MKQLLLNLILFHLCCIWQRILRPRSLSWQNKEQNVQVILQEAIKTGSLHQVKQALQHGADPSTPWVQYTAHRGLPPAFLDILIPAEFDINYDLDHCGSYFVDNTQTNDHKLIVYLLQHSAMSCPLPSPGMCSTEKFA